MITKDTAAPKGSNSIKRKRMTSTVTFRLSYTLKEGLLNLAEKQGRSLSSLIQQGLQDLLNSHECGGGPVRIAQEEKRQHLRREILLPARWRIRKGQKLLEHDVLLKNISVGGAYTEYMSGQSFQFIRNLGVLPLALAVRMPGLQEPVVLDCEVKRIHATEGFVGVGLGFTKEFEDEWLPD
jgi:predicted transcriptional regulator